MSKSIAVSHLADEARRSDGATQGLSQSAAPSIAGLLGLAIGSIGVVYGDIGTSPLYAFR